MCIWFCVMCILVYTCVLRARSLPKDNARQLQEVQQQLQQQQQAQATGMLLLRV